MELLQQSLLAFFAAVGIAWAAWTAAEALFLSKKETLEKCVVLVPVTKSAPALERTVAGLQWATVCGRRFDKILIADCGLDDEAKALARLLAQDNANVALCTMGEAKEHLL